jgi:hypothetical protein
MFIPDPGSRIPDPGFSHPGSRIPDPGSQISDPGSRIPDPGSQKTWGGKKRAIFQILGHKKPLVQKREKKYSK